MAVALANAGADIVAVGRSSPKTPRSWFARPAAASIASKPIWDQPRIRAKSSSRLSSIRRSRHPRQQCWNHPAQRRSRISEADWDAVMNVNLKSAFFLCQAVARSMIKLGRAARSSTLLDAVLSGRRSRGFVYGEQERHRRNNAPAANEWASKGINVNAIAPAT